MGKKKNFEVSEATLFEQIKDLMKHHFDCESEFLGFLDIDNMLTNEKDYIIDQSTMEFVSAEKYNALDKKGLGLPDAIKENEFFYIFYAWESGVTEEELANLYGLPLYGVIEYNEDFYTSLYKKQHELSKAGKLFFSEKSFITNVVEKIDELGLDPSEFYFDTKKVNGYWNVLAFKYNSYPSICGAVRILTDPDEFLELVKSDDEDDEDDE